MVCIMKSSLKFVWKTSSSLFNCLGIFFAKADTKKRRYASAIASAFANCRGEFWMLMFCLAFRKFHFYYLHLSLVSLLLLQQKNKETNLVSWKYVIEISREVLQNISLLKNVKINYMDLTMFMCLNV